MKRYAPIYYPNFTCIADRCQHSCCVGWEIDLDPEAARRYENCTAAYGETLRRSVCWEAEPPSFRLDEAERCPHLTDAGLCRMILELGEDWLCDICREHPRFYHNTPMGEEVGLGMACEEACRLILEEPEYWRFAEVGETPEPEEAPGEFDPLPHREHLYELLSDGSVPYPRRLAEIARQYGVDPAGIPEERWHQLLAELEYLHPEHRALFACYHADPKPDAALLPLLERVLAYFIFRHCSGQREEIEFRLSLGFALFCERLLASLAEQADPAAFPELARVLSEELEYSEDNTEAIREEFWLDGLE